MNEGSWLRAGAEGLSYINTDRQIEEEATGEQRWRQRLNFKSHTPFDAVKVFIIHVEIFTDVIWMDFCPALYSRIRPGDGAYAHYRCSSISSTLGRLMTSLIRQLRDFLLSVYSLSAYIYYSRRLFHFVDSHLAYVIILSGTEWNPSRVGLAR